MHKILNCSFVLKTFHGIVIMLFIFSSSCFSQDTIYTTDSYFYKYMSVGKLVNNKFEGKVKSFRYRNSDSTDLDPIYFITDYENGKMNGSRYTYTREGKLLLSAQVKNDSLNGNQIRYEDSSIVEIEYYINDKRNGSTIAYLDNKLFSIEEYKNDSANGIYVEFYPDGKVKLKGSQENGLRIGIWTEFDSTYAYFYTGEYAPKIYWIYDHSADRSISVKHFGYEKIGIWTKYTLSGIKVEETKFTPTPE